MSEPPERQSVLFVQLPLNTSAALEATGNIPLAGASLAAAASYPFESVFPQYLADKLGDRALVKEIVKRSPDVVAFTLYMWNSERTVYIAGRVRSLLPDAILAAGGPEVSRDNGWIRDSGVFDLLVEGEGEPFAEIFAENRRLRRLAKDSRGFAVSGANTFLPGAYPDPWLSGYLDPSEGASVHVETVRGCPGSCVYCSYRRTHPVPRVLDARRAAALLGKLADAGAGELVLLDPTFNTREDLIPLLREMRHLKASFFAELRGDLITPETAGLMAEAGFESVEIGLQTTNRNTLAGTGRPVDPDAVLSGVRFFKREGVSPVIDVMLGLPGDTPEDSLRTAQAIADSGLQNEMQVFYLSWLPGTALRKSSEADYMNRPPYWGKETAGSQEWREARERIADIAGYDLHLSHRPLLFDEWPGTETVCLDNSPDVQRKMPSLRHGALRLHAENMWQHRKLMKLFVKSRYQADPFCVLDVIIVPSVHFPLDIIDMIREIESSGESDYTRRTAAVLEKQGKLRVSVLLSDFRKFPEDWILAAAECCTVAVDAAEPEDVPEGLLQNDILVRLPGTQWKMPDLFSRAVSPHSLLFSEKCMEEAWTEAMGL